MFDLITGFHFTLHLYYSNLGPCTLAAFGPCRSYAQLFDVLNDVICQFVTQVRLNMPNFPALMKKNIHVVLFGLKWASGRQITLNKNFAVAKKTPTNGHKFSNARPT
jgi:hypothetical protein